MNLIRYTLGDYSADGHGMTSTFILNCNMSVDELEKAIDKGQKITGINLDNLCSEYEDNSIPRGVYNYMTEKGVVFDKYAAQRFEQGYYDIWIGDEEYMGLVLALAREGNPDIDVQYAQGIQNLNSGYGYGLFSL